MAEKRIGFTDLIGRRDVSKTDIRFEAIGAIDEASSAVSLAKAFCALSDRKRILEKSQQDLSIIMADLAGMSQFSTSVNGGFSVLQTALEALDQTIADLKKQISNPGSFILGGANPYSGALNLARSVARRAERETLKLFESEGPVDDTIAKYLNSLSMMLFLLELEAETSVQ